MVGHKEGYAVRLPFLGNMKIITWSEALGKTECPYLYRWVINLGLFSVRLHHWIASDDDRNFHDHPCNFATLILSDGYTDISLEKSDRLSRGSIRMRSALHRHTVKVNPGGCWSILITGPEKRIWGFWVNGRFRKRSKYFYMFGHHPCER